jgi:RNA polymerase sigma factor (sigma-70 family)
MSDNPIDSLPQGEWDKLISSILRPYLSFAVNDPLISREDLEQEAWVALMTAASNYDPTKSKFSTYAYHYILGRIRRYVLEKTRVSSSRIDIDPIEIESGYIDNTIEDTELVKSIMLAVSDQPHAHFLVEHFIKGKSFRKIAKENGMSHQGVVMHVKKLINILEKRMNHENA